MVGRHTVINTVEFSGSNRLETMKICFSEG